ncbi:MAG: hypothetical protein ACLFNT_11540 [Spirochaetales bacterium]
MLGAASAHDQPWQALEAGCLEFLRSAASREYQQIVLSDAPALLGIATWRQLDSRYTTSTLKEALDELDRDEFLDTASTSAAAQAPSGAMNQLARWVGSGNDALAAETVLLQLLRSLSRWGVTDRGDTTAVKAHGIGICSIGKPGSQVQRAKC